MGTAGTRRVVPVCAMKCVGYAEVIPTDIKHSAANSVRIGLAK